MNYEVKILNRLNISFLNNRTQPMFNIFWKKEKYYYLICILLHQSLSPITTGA